MTQSLLLLSYPTGPNNVLKIQADHVNPGLHTHYQLPGASAATQPLTVAPECCRPRGLHAWQDRQWPRAPGGGPLTALWAPSSPSNTPNVFSPGHPVHDRTPHPTPGCFIPHYAAVCSCVMGPPRTLELREGRTRPYSAAQSQPWDSQLTTAVRARQYLLNE